MNQSFASRCSPGMYVCVAIDRDIGGTLVTDDEGQPLLRVRSAFQLAVP